MSLESILEFKVWDNTVIKYAVFIAVVVGSWIVGWLVNAVIKGKLKSLAEKTETKIDDLVIGIIGGPVVLLVTLVGISMGSKLMEGGFQSLAEQVYSALVYVAGAWIVFRAIDGINTHYLTPFLSKTETKVDDVLVPVIIRALKVLIAIFVTLLALERFGYGVAPIVNFLLGFAMMLLATAAVSTIWVFRSVVGGLVILFNKPFAEGDRIAFGSLEGTVEKLELQRVILRTADGLKVIVPNHELINVPVKILAEAPAPQKPAEAKKPAAPAEEPPPEDAV